MNHRVFDDYAEQVVGEHVWNFADFRTSNAIFRWAATSSAAFTQDRKPKAAAHLLRERWTNLVADPPCRWLSLSNSSRWSSVSKPI